MDPPGDTVADSAQNFSHRLEQEEGKTSHHPSKPPFAYVVDCFSRHCTEYLATKSSANSVSSTEAHGERILFHRHDSSISSAGSSTSISSESIRSRVGKTSEPSCFEANGSVVTDNKSDSTCGLEITRDDDSTLEVLSAVGGLMEHEMKVDGSSLREDPYDSNGGQRTHFASGAVLCELEAVLEVRRVSHSAQKIRRRSLQSNTTTGAIEEVAPNFDVEEEKRGFKDISKRIGSDEDDHMQERNQKQKENGASHTGLTAPSPRGELSHLPLLDELKTSSAFAMAVTRNALLTSSVQQHDTGEIYGDGH